LAAILLGPSVGVVVVTIVVVVQALVFADGGLTALGYNVLNMAVIPAYGGYAVFRLLRRMLPQNTGGVIGATGVAAWASVVMASIAFSIQWLFGANLVYGASDLDQAQLAETKVKTRTFVIGGTLVALIFAAVVSQFAYDDPDGLERVAEDTGFISSGEDHALADFIFADYATSGISNEALSLAIAGIVGTLVTLAVAAGIFLTIKERRQREPAAV
jgi:cobalt/nickel transport system permease protein